MRNMSFALTTEQVRNRTKTVTRRLGWEFLRPGDLIRPVEKCMGLKKGETLTPVGTAVLRVVSVRREALQRLTDDLDYGVDEVRREGFADREGPWSPAEFVTFFCRTHRLPTLYATRPERISRVCLQRSRPCAPGDEVTRIEFEYVDQGD